MQSIVPYRFVGEHGLVLDHHAQLNNQVTNFVRATKPQKKEKHRHKDTTERERDRDRDKGFAYSL